MQGLAPEARAGVRLPRHCLLLTLLLLLTVAAGPFAQSASASKAWCRTDPVISVNGYVSDVFVSGPLTALLQVTGPTEIVVTVPVGVDAWLVLADLGFGRGTNVTFEESHSLENSTQGAEVRIEVYVPSRDDAMPVRVEVAPRLLGLLSPVSAEGTANQWIVVMARL
jgi:hypothetical protein